MDKCLVPNSTYTFTLTAYNEADDEDSESVVVTAHTQPIETVSTEIMRK
jgi:hypothetical protein